MMCLQNMSLFHLDINLYLFTFQSGPGDLTNIDPRFTELPVPHSLGACEESGATFPGFTYTNENIFSLTRGH